LLATPAARSLRNTARSTCSNTCHQVKVTKT
jgi:hypothetical protein